MKFNNIKPLVLLIAMFVMMAMPVCAEDKAQNAVVSALAGFFASPAARADLAAENSEAMQAEQTLRAFPPHIQKRLEKVVLMIVQEGMADPNRPANPPNAAGPEGVLQSFSPAVQREIQAIAQELEKDPGFMKKGRTLK